MNSEEGARRKAKRSAAAKKLQKDGADARPATVGVLRTKGGVPNRAARSGDSATMIDVARAAGVGVGTVSRVVNLSPRVTAETKTRVEAAIAKLGFKPDPIAQSMRSGHTKTFACVVRDLTVPVLSVFIDAMQKAVDAQDFGLFVASSYHDIAREMSYLVRFARRRADGIVIATSSEEAPKLLKLLRESEMPIVLLDRTKPETLDAVLVDHRAGMRQAMEYLTSLGHARIGFISGQDDVHPVRERLAGYREGLAAQGLAVDESLIRLGSFGVEHAYSETMQLLALQKRPSAVIAAGTALLPGMLRAVRDRGAKIPENISIISGSDSELAMLHTPGITVVRWDHSQLGVAAARFLLNRLQSPGHQIQRMIFPSELAVRGSCGPPAKVR